MESSYPSCTVLAAIRFSQTTTREKLSHGAAEQLKDKPIIGYTTSADSGICQAADELIKKHGTYNLAFRNCQHFAEELAKLIIDTAIVEPDPNIQYRFTPDSLKFMSSFAHSGCQPGWILPTPSKILVNVMQTNDLDTWTGQVEGSEERGMLHSSFVQRV